MIQLTVTIAAHYTDRDDYPADIVNSRETAIVQIPQLEAKFVQFPKLLDGLTGRAIERLRAAASTHDRQLANPTLFDEPADDPAEDDDPIALAAHWPSLADVELHDVLVTHTMDQLDPATRARCHQHGLILGLIDPAEPGALEHTWYQMQPSGDILRGELYGNFYECAAAGLAYLDTLEEDEPAEEEPEPVGEPEPDEAAGEWHLTNFRTAEIDELAGHGYQIQARWRRLGDGFEWQYRWRVFAQDRFDVSPPFTAIEDAITDARRYIEEPAEAPQEQPA